MTLAPAANNMMQIMQKLAWGIRKYLRRKCVDGDSKKHGSLRHEKVPITWGGQFPPRIADSHVCSSGDSRRTLDRDSSGVSGE